MNNEQPHPPYSYLHPEESDPAEPTREDLELEISECPKLSQRLSDAVWALWSGKAAALDGACAIDEVFNDARERIMDRRN